MFTIPPPPRVSHDFDAIRYPLLKPVTSLCSVAFSVLFCVHAKLCRRPFGVACMIHILTLQLTNCWLPINSGCHGFQITRWWRHVPVHSSVCVCVCVCVCVFRIPEGKRDFCRLQKVQIASGAHPASCSVGNGGFSPGVKAVGTWSWPLTYI
jgi:hypothetical protein